MTPVWSKGRYVGRFLVDELNALAITENYGPLFEEKNGVIYAHRSRGAPSLLWIINEHYLKRKFLPEGMQELHKYRELQLDLIRYQVIFV